MVKSKNGASYCKRLGVALDYSELIADLDVDRTFAPTTLTFRQATSKVTRALYEVWLKDCNRKK